MTRVPPSLHLVSYDVTALFTSVPVDDSVTIIRDILHQDPTLSERTSLSAAQVTELLCICLTTYFVYSSEFYVQEGAAMGSPVRPIVVNLFMEHFEEKALISFHHSLKFWGRYVDDTMVAILSHLIEEFIIHLNSLDDRIQFMVEHQQDRCIPMLDTKISILDEGSLKFEVYRKKTHTDQYLQYDSHQPLQHKLGVVRTLTHRATTITTKPEDLAREMLHLHMVLHISGYPSWVTKAPSTTKVIPHPSTNKTHVAGHVTLPDIEDVTEAISRKLRQQGVVTHAVPFDAIRKRLRSPNDTDSISNLCGVVYQLECSECGENNIGETERPLKKRLNEPRRESSPVGHHLCYSGHHLPEEKVLDQDSRWFQRGVKEALHIRSHSPSLNRD